MFQTLAHYPTLVKLLLALIPSKFLEEREKHMQMTLAKLKRRMEAGKDRADLVEGLLKKADEWVTNLTHQDVCLSRIEADSTRGSRWRNSRPTAQSSSSGDQKRRRRSFQG